MTDLQRMARNAGCRVTKSGIKPPCARWRRFKEIMAAEPEQIELGLSIFLIALGLRSFLPIPVFTGMMHEFSKVFGMSIVGLWTVSLGTIRLAAVLEENYAVRKITSGFSFFTWCAFFVTSLLAQPYSYSPIIYLFLAAASFRVFWSFGGKELGNDE